MQYSTIQSSSNAANGSQRQLPGNCTRVAATAVCRGWHCHLSLPSPLWAAVTVAARHKGYAMMVTDATSCSPRLLSLCLWLPKRSSAVRHFQASIACVAQARQKSHPALLPATMHKHQDLACW